MFPDNLSWAIEGKFWRSQLAWSRNKYQAPHPEEAVTTEYLTPIHMLVFVPCGTSLVAVTCVNKLGTRELTWCYNHPYIARGGSPILTQGTSCEN